MEFKDFNQLLQENFKKMVENTNHMFEVDVNTEELWNIYLDSFPKGTNEIFRERREYDCSCCRQFIRDIGNAVTIESNKINTVWDFETNSATFQPVVDALSNYIKSKIISDIHVSKFSKIGVNKNFEQLEGGKVIEWSHFYLELPNKLVDKSSKSEGDIKGGYRDTRNVFKRSLEEISEDSLLTVLELISQNSLYKGDEWNAVLSEFLKHKKEYDKLETKEERENYTWEQSVKVGAVIGRIRNHSIGTLLINISENMDLDLAVKKYESIVAPENYRRSVPIFSKKMLESAKEKIQELGYSDSLDRRFAKLDDITINNILFSDKDSTKAINKDIFNTMLDEISVVSKSFSRVEEITINDFIANVLPSVKRLEVLLENKHLSNMVSLIAPKNKDSKTIFKWNNNFSWAYSGNIADSSMRDRVKSAGGDVDGVLRFSIQWNDGLDHDGNDLDAHCLEPNGHEIFFGTRNPMRPNPTTGKLDVDIQYPEKDKPAVENITWANKEKMGVGTYKLFVHNYYNRGGRDGFKAEIEFDGQIHSFEYNREIKQGEKVQVAEVMLDNDGNFTIKELLSSSTSSREIWGLSTNQFHNVGIVCKSPNYWNEQEGIGHKHYMFLLKDCTSTERPNSFYNEFLNQELNGHRKVMEALGSRLRVEDDIDQLSGIGFSSTKRNELTVRVESNTKRILKIKF